MSKYKGRKRNLNVRASKFNRAHGRLKLRQILSSTSGASIKHRSIKRKIRSEEESGGGEQRVNGGERDPMMAREPGEMGNRCFYQVCVSRAQFLAQYMAQLIIFEFIKS